MSVSNVMDAMMTQDSSESLSASPVSTGVPSGSSASGKPVVSSVDDIFNLYDPSGEEDSPADNGIELKEDKSAVPSDLPKEEKKKETEEESEEVKKEEQIDLTPEKQESMPETVKVKVNGVETEVPLKDVINSYSGQQEIQRRFTEFDKQKKAWEKEASQEREFTGYVKQEIGDLRGTMESLIGQYQKNGFLDKNPLEAVNQLLDKMGINSNLFEKAVFEHQLPDYARYFNMSDVERDAHFTKKENEYLRKKESTISERDQHVKLQQEKQQKDFEFIRNAGLDSVKYEELSSELLEAGHKEITAESVVEYAKQKPTLEKVVKTFQEIGLDAQSDPRSRTVFNLFKDFPDTTIEEVLEHLDPKRAALKSAQVLKGKEQKPARVPPNQKMDAEDDELLQFFRR